MPTPTTRPRRTLTLLLLALAAATPAACSPNGASPAVAAPAQADAFGAAASRLPAVPSAGSCQAAPAPIPSRRHLPGDEGCRETPTLAAR